MIILKKKHEEILKQESDISYKKGFEIGKIIINARNNTDVSKLLKEKAFWEGKLEVAEYVKFFAK